MKFSLRPGWITSALLALLVLGDAGCGKGTVTFGQGEDDDSKSTVTFKGNLDDVFPVTSRDIVLFVYSIDDDDHQCPCPVDPNTLHPANELEGKTTVITGNETEFSISGLEPGAFSVVFLLDKAGDEADGEINPGDDIAILDDPDCELDDVTGKLTVTLEDVDLRFDDAPEDCNSGSPPAPGRGRADEIRKATTVNTNDD